MVWIGLNDESVEGEYRWISSGTVATYYYWHGPSHGGSEPNNYDASGGPENCVAISHTSFGLWKDTKCTHRCFHLCEY